MRIYERRDKLKISNTIINMQEIDSSNIGENALEIEEKKKTYCQGKNKKHEHVFVLY